MAKRARETFASTLGTVYGGQEFPDNDPRVLGDPTMFDDVTTTTTEIAYDSDGVPYLK